jgi:hypothetical protein
MQYRTNEYNADLHDKFNALSVNQPFADMISKGIKKIEVRSRATKHRGNILIVSSKKVFDGYEYNEEDRIGVSICRVELYDCKPLKECTEEELALTCLKRDELIKALKSGHYAWFLKNPIPVIEFPVKGQLGIFSLVYDKDFILDYPNSSFRNVK